MVGVRFRLSLLSDAWEAECYSDGDGVVMFR